MRKYTLYTISIGIWYHVFDGQMTDAFADLDLFSDFLQHLESLDTFLKEVALEAHERDVQSYGLNKL